MSGLILLYDPGVRPAMDNLNNVLRLEVYGLSVKNPFNTKTGTFSQQKQSVGNYFFS